jgi:hypothetical protein
MAMQGLLLSQEGNEKTTTPPLAATSSIHHTTSIQKNIPSASTPLDRSPAGEMGILLLKRR